MNSNLKKQRWLNIMLLMGLVLFSSARMAKDSTLLKMPNQKKKTGLVYVFEIRKEIAKPVLRLTQEAFKEAEALHADYILIRINTYGGRVDIADSIRTRILNSHIPVMVFIDNQAISAGSLISIAADSIFMRPGASIGAATVVNQSGQPVPDKYQSFMRSTMRATAEAHGYDTIIKGNDTIYKWRRNPHIAEAMVDPRIVVKGVIDSGKVLTLTTDEAIKVGYCEGKASSIKEVLKKAGLSNYKVKMFHETAMDSLLNFLLNPIAETIFILMIIGGIYFELQSPGIGFPLAVAILGALLYFAPLYVQGFAQYWEMIVFVVGLILLGIEIFVIPGFGITGIAGILLMIIGLTMGLVDNVAFKYEGTAAFGQVAKVFLRISLTVVGSFLLTLWLSSKAGTSKLFSRISLATHQEKSEGYVSIDVRQKKMIGKSGIAHTMLRPSGKVNIDGEIFDAKAEISYIEKGEKITVIRDEAGQLYVVKLDDRFDDIP